MSTNPQNSTNGDVKDVALAETGKRRIEWAFQSMTALQAIRKQFIKTQPLAGVRVAACLHVTAETANLMVTLRDGGASPVLCAANSLSTQDEVAASLVRDYGVPVYAVRDESAESYCAHLLAAIDHKPQITIDGGAALAATMHARRPDALEEAVGGTEETAAGVMRLEAMVREGVLRYPVIAVNESMTQRLLDSRYGTGQSVIDAVIRATNVLLAGMTVVVAGYGWCGRGVAVRARGLGANVIVTETDPMRAVEALMDGFRVMSMAEAAAAGDLFVTATGNKSAIGREHFDKLKSGAIVANAGHANAEIDLECLAKTASSRRVVRELVEEYALKDGRRVYVLAEGRLINLAAGEGHPASAMDMCFAMQALAVEHVVKNAASLEKRVYPAPEEIDRKVARMKIEAMGVKIDRLTPDQERSLGSWSEGI
jgi:adenosylhomocysteinase